MSFLLDTNVLIRLANSSDALRNTAFAATAELHRRGEDLFIGSQNVAEFWSVATRPTINNGLGMAVEDAAELVEYFESDFRIVPDSPLIYPAWKQLVIEAGVTGKHVHDARLVAICRVNQIENLLTFNGRQFARYATVATNFNIVEPATIVGQRQ
jgi:predicted nucleic acid-binding protein